MGTCRRLTGTAALLIGLQLFNPAKACAQTQLSTKSVNRRVVQAEMVDSHQLVKADKPAKPFQPKPKPKEPGGPRTTQGSGTR